MQLTLRNTFRALSAALLMSVGLWLPSIASAQGFSLVPACAKQATANTAPGLDCALETFAGIARFLFGIMGSAALLMFVIGGFFILSSAGNDKLVSKGKDYVKNAVIGIVIILVSAYAIQYGVNVLRGGQEGVSCEGEIYTNEAKQQVCCAGTVVIGMTGSNRGKNQCVTSCSEYGTAVGRSFACQNTLNRSGGGSGCIGGLCDGNADQLCCPTAP